MPLRTTARGNLRLRIAASRWNLRAGDWTGYTFAKPSRYTAFGGWESRAESSSLAILLPHPERRFHTPTPLTGLSR